MYTLNRGVLKKGGAYIWRSCGVFLYVNYDCNDAFLTKRNLIHQMKLCWTSGCSSCEGVDVVYQSEVPTPSWWKQTREVVDTRNDISFLIGDVLFFLSPGLFSWTVLRTGLVESGSAVNQAGYVTKGKCSAFLYRVLQQHGKLTFKLLGSLHDVSFLHMNSPTIEEIRSTIVDCRVERMCLILLFLNSHVCGNTAVSLPWMKGLFIACIHHCFLKRQHILSLL